MDCGHIVAIVDHNASWAAQTGKHLLLTQNVSEQNQKHFMCPGHKICVRNKCCARGQTGNICVGNNVSSFARAFTSRADSSWRFKPWRRRALLHLKRKIPDSWRTGWIAKVRIKFALYLKVFKNHFYYLWHVRVLPIKPCLHTHRPEHQ